MPKNKFLELIQATIKIAIIEDIFPIEDNIQYINNLQDVELSKIIPQRIISHNSDNSDNSDNKDNIAMAKIFTRQQMVFCGEDMVNTALQLVLPTSNYQVEWYFHDGDRLDVNDTICRITAPSAILLLLERTILNFIQLLSATATTTRQYVDAISGCSAIDGQPVKILDTRKTIPHLRFLQKYAVKTGGGFNQRFGLYDAILIKENNLKKFASIKDAVDFYQAQALSITPNDLWAEKYQIQLEVETLTQFTEALKLQVPQIMLDNMTFEQINTCIQKLKTYYNQGLSNQNFKKIELEISGDVTINNVRQYALTGIHRISIGSLTKNVSAINLSMLIE